MHANLQKKLCSALLLSTIPAATAVASANTSQDGKRAKGDKNDPIASFEPNDAVFKDLMEMHEKASPLQLNDTKSKTSFNMTLEETGLNATRGGGGLPVEVEVHLE
ncbi:uncharacterized protein SPSK_02792 [Sporothrix schenckii 1099-18]|uniref:Uncharacterized protein n=2 Tax=Sporothrix schenckii TaxID=29908 RepID=U7PPS4_SPOS1|nr:uncharacterized protein SPSK_02792 [Sporothrix schenckii 1099-18]ERS96916.1 hypothetical protein HMPREF1624_06243 [Sporothrix schenckii ATCC 58251]KJR86102.1 hypothetical protein SPSK_02792 [Sporothrix schenckii 1099-18]